MIFQAFTTGYLITTTESILLTGKRSPPLWLQLLTLLAGGSALAGGILLLLLLNTSEGSLDDFTDTFVGALAVLMTFFYPAMVAIRSYLRLENPMTIPRSSIVSVDKDGSAVFLLATLKDGKKPVWFRFNTRCEEEAETVRFNLAVHAKGRLRCYPITFLPKTGTAAAAGSTPQVKGPVQL